jgi:hypothetical protein
MVSKDQGQRSSQPVQPILTQVKLDARLGQILLKCSAYYHLNHGQDWIRLGYRLASSGKHSEYAIILCKTLKRALGFSLIVHQRQNLPVFTLII